MPYGSDGNPTEAPDTRPVYSSGASTKHAARKVGKVILFIDSFALNPSIQIAGLELVTVTPDTHTRLPV